MSMMLENPVLSYFLTCTEIQPRVAHIVRRLELVVVQNHCNVPHLQLCRFRQLHATSVPPTVVSSQFQLVTMVRVGGCDAVENGIFHTVSEQRSKGFSHGAREGEQLGGSMMLEQ